jgi:glycine/D-amino acid oxidase-like deaminating enzyme/nitrite reductase/ring-hydroxylating ferredoxin subunit
LNSFWIDSTKNQVNFSSLEDDLNVDVCIIGAGIFGLSTAYYLSSQGLKVAVLEKDFIGSKTSGYTTAKITSQHGLIYKHLIDDYNYNFAKKYLDANQLAIENISNIIIKENIDCDFERQNSYVYSDNLEGLNKIKSEVESVQSLGFNANFINNLDVPFSYNGAIEFPNQAQFHPRKYMIGLCNAIIKNGGEIFENSAVYDIKKNGNNYLVKLNKNIVNCKYVVLASHYPFINIPGFYFTKMYQDTSYIIAIETTSNLFDGMYISSSSPVFSFRTMKDNNKKLLLIGGAGHKTGTNVNFQSTYGILEAKAHELYSDCIVKYRWNTRDCITLDKIPYIGNFSNTMPNVFIGTGFNKWGMTSSNVAANIISDKILNKSNKYEDIFSATRMHPIKNRWEMKNILKQSASSLIFNKLISYSDQILSIENDNGAILEIDGDKVGIYKDSDGNIFAINPICTHLGCLLSWNNVDKTWDCPCHGSRFDYTGKNIYDPAFKNLDIFDINT